MAGKEAIAFVLDSSPSMMTPYPSSSTETNRLSCAKSALVGMLSNLMIQSKTNQAGVVVVKTQETHHTMEILDDNDNVPYTHVTELMAEGKNSILRPTVDLLRAVDKVESTLSPEEVNAVGGDLGVGLTVAADAMYRSTFGKKYKRRIVVFTDAGHHLKVDPQEMLHIMEGLREMECTLTVIGLDFEKSADFEHAASTSLVEEAKTPQVEELSEKDSDEPVNKQDEEDGSETEGSENDESEDEKNADGTDDGDASGITTYKKKQDIEKLLIRLARLTGGSVIASSTMQQVLDSTLGKRIPKSTRRKCELRVTPDLMVDARFSLLISKSNIPSLKKEAVLLDDDKQPMINGIGQEMRNEITSITNHLDPDNPMTHVTYEHLTQGYRYGSDFVPLGVLDKFGLQNHSPCCINIIGYTHVDNVPMRYYIGPPYVVSGADSRRACVAISSLAQALEKLKRVALCTFVKMKNADKILGALFPFDEKDETGATAAAAASRTVSRLVFLQLPFANDVLKLAMPSIDEYVVDDRGKKNVCHDLIDSLMLPPDSLRSERIASPAIRAYHKTVMHRAIDPSAPIVPYRNHSGENEDPMSTPSGILEKSRSHLEAFRKAFPLEKPEEGSAESGGNPKKKQKFWLGS